jgi:hypothetical protein
MRQKRTMADIARLLAADENKSASGGLSSKQYYPFYKAPAGSVIVFRPVPDRNPDNPFCWVEKRVIKLRFPGMIRSDQDTDGAVLVNIPCPETHGDKCPIAQAIKPLWSGTEREQEIAKQAYRKPSFIVGGFVQSSPFVEPQVPENPIRYLEMSKQVFANFKAGLVNSDYEDLPWDTESGGRAFRIIVTQQGPYKNYSTSMWAGRTSELSQAEKAALEKYGLPDLAAELGPRLTPEQIALMPELYADWLVGRPFDSAKYGSFARAFPLKEPGAASGPSAGPPPSEASVQATQSTVARLAPRAQIGGA